MAKPIESDIPPAFSPIPPLKAGQRLTRDEFERRYQAMPHLKKAELIEGVVYMPSPVQVDHGRPHLRLICWIGNYEAETPGVWGMDNTTPRLDMANEPQPDGLLLIDPALGGQARISDDGFVEQSPELTAEVALTSERFDLNTVLPLYRRCGVQEFLLWRVRRRTIDWFVLKGGDYQSLAPNDQGVLKSETFPGLWLDVQAMIDGDLKQALAVLQHGLASPEHAAFVQRLADQADT